MFLHKLMLLVAIGCLMDHGFVEGRRQNYNSNTNYNQLSGYGFGKGRAGLYGGSPKYEIVLGPEMMNGKDRAGLPGLYTGPKKYEIVLGADMLDGRDRGGLLKYVKGGSTGSGILGNDFVASEDSVDRAGYDRGSCDALADILLRDDDDEELAARKPPADDDGGLESLFDDNGNYNVVFKGSNRRNLSPQPHGLNAGLSDNAGSKQLRTYNWGTLRPSYLNTGNNDRINWDNDRINQDYDRINQDYDRNSLLYDRTEEEYERPSQNYDRGYGNTNVNTNSNYKTFGARRRNLNSNANNNVMSYGGYGQDSGNRRYETTPSYSDYGRGRQGYGPQGSYGGYTTGYPSVGFTPRPTYAGQPDNDVIEDDDEDTDSEQNVNSNVNMNANVNMMSRRQNVKSKPNNNLYPRKKRSVNEFPNVSAGVGLEVNREASNVPEPEISTVAKPITDILKKPRDSIHRNLV